MSDPEAADEAEVRARAVKLLARREHAPAELTEKLARRGYPRRLCEDVVAALVDENLVSAARYAESLARSRAERGYGPVRIRAELAAAGVNDACIDDALASVDVDWHGSAMVECRKRFGDGPPQDFPAKAKQMRFLQQRGFTTEQIRSAVDDTD